MTVLLLHFLDSLVVETHSPFLVLLRQLDLLRLNAKEPHDALESRWLSSITLCGKGHLAKRTLLGVLEHLLFDTALAEGVQAVLDDLGLTEVALADGAPELVFDCFLVQRGDRLHSELLQHLLRDRANRPLLFKDSFQPVIQVLILSVYKLSLLLHG